MIFHRLLFLIALSISSSVWSHDPFAVQEPGQGPIVLAATLLFLFWLSYSLGALTVWPGWKRFFVFQTAALIIGFTIFGPLDEWAEVNTAMHMTQHMLMMVVIAPLWVLAQPLPQFAASKVRVIIRLGKPLFPLLRYPMLAACLHGVVIWFWHAPKLYNLALYNPWWHIIEHACFLLTAGLFWWAVLRSTQSRAPRAFLALLFTLMHTGFLGALLTFAQVDLYDAKRSLESQQLAGLIMWVVGSVPYLIAAFWCAERWFQQMKN